MNYTITKITLKTYKKLLNLFYFLLNTSSLPIKLLNTNLKMIHPHLMKSCQFFIEKPKTLIVKTLKNLVILYFFYLLIQKYKFSLVLF